MTRIDRFQQLTQALHGKALAAGSETRMEGKSVASGAAPAGSLDRLKKKLQPALQQLDLTRPEAAEQAIGLFVDTLLTEDFDAGFMARASGQELANRIRAVLLSDAASREALMEVLAELAAAPPV